MHVIHIPVILILILILKNFSYKKAEIANINLYTISKSGVELIQSDVIT